VSDYDVIVRELELFPGRDASGERLQDKPMLVAANKIDALDDPTRLERLRTHLAGRGIPLHAVSAASGEGVPALLEALWGALQGRPPRASSTGGSGEPGERAYQNRHG